MHRAPLAFLALLALLPRVGSTAPIETKAYVVTTDFTTGGLSAVDLATRAVSPDVASVHSDATLRWWGGRLYVVNRFGQDNIQVIDPAQGYATVRQFSTGNGSNPQDIAVVSPTKAYVSCLGLAELLIVNPAAGTVTGSISLTPFADGDGPPEAAHLALGDGRLFVALQRLVNFVPAETSLVAVIDTRADTVLDVNPARPGVQAIPLVGRNPTTSFEYDPFGGRLLIGCAGAFGVLDGGIEAIPVVGGDVIVPGQPLYQSTGFLITEQELGGELADLAFLLPGHSYAIVSDASFDASVVAWNTLTGLKLGTVYKPGGGGGLPDMALSPMRDELWVCDTKSTAPGLRVFRCGTDSPLAGPLATGLPPYQITFDRDDISFASHLLSVAPPAAEPRPLAFTRAWPNPARDGITMSLSGTDAGPLQVEVLDLAGRQVRRWVVEAPTRNATTVRWDLRAEDGNRVPAGVYVVRAREGGMSTARQVIAVR